MCAPYFTKTYAVRPVSHTWLRSCGQQIHANVQGAMQQQLIRGHNPRLLDEVGSQAPAAPVTQKARIVSTC